MKEFIKPEMEIIVFKTEDVIVASGGSETVIGPDEG